MAKTIQMRRNRFGQFVAKGRGGAKKRNPPAKKRAPAAKKRAPAKKRAAKKNTPTPWTAGVVTNRKKKKNPPTMSLDKQGVLLGIPFPAVSDVLYMSLGLGGPPFIKGFVMRLPIVTTYANNQMAMYAIETVSYAAPIGIGYAIGGTRGVRRVIAGEAAGVLVRLVAKYTQVGRIPRGAPGVKGYLNPTANQSLRGMRGYTKPVNQAMLRGLPTRTPQAASFNRTRRTSRYA